MPLFIWEEAIPTTDPEPEPTADSELELTPALNPEQMPAVMSIPEQKRCDHVCVGCTSVTVVILVELDEEVQEAVHGVTIEQVQKSLYGNDWNPVRAEQQLKTDQLYYTTQCSREECQKILARYNWDL